MIYIMFLEVVFCLKYCIKNIINIIKVIFNIDDRIGIVGFNLCFENKM